jgi:hypothetical protein
MTRVSRRITTLLLIAVCAALPSWALADSVNVLVAASEKMKNARYRMEMTTTTNGKASASETRAEFDGPDRYHLWIDKSTEEIGVPGASWIRLFGSSGQWTKAKPTGMDGKLRCLMPNLLCDPQIRSSTTHLRDEGMTTFNGQAAHAYSVEIFPGMPRITVYLNSAGQSVGSEVKMNGGDVLTTVLTYDNAIRIQPPAGQ